MQQAVEDFLDCCNSCFFCSSHVKQEKSAYHFLLLETVKKRLGRAWKGSGEAITMADMTLDDFVCQNYGS